MRKWIYIAVLTFSYAMSASLPGSTVNEFIILHNNDMHARFEQTNRNSGVCTQKDSIRDKCYGGFARVAHE